MQYAKDMQSPFKELFLATRKRILALNGVTEIKKEKITTYGFNGAGLCHVRTTLHGVDVGFLKGAFINDTYRLLHGTTKRMRVLSLQAMLKKELQYYLDEAIKLNT